jgi:hypothetical protein
MRALRLVLQIVGPLLISFVITALTMPAILMSVPAAREGRIGIALTAGVAAVSFILVWLAWPRRKP